MARYIILFDEVTGVNGLRHLKGSKVDESQLLSDSISTLLEIKAIKPEKEIEKVIKIKEDK